MKALLLTAAFLLIAAPVKAQVNPKIAKQCQSAVDFAGCVKAFTTPAVVADDIQPLRNAMKQVAERLSAGTSLSNSSTTYQPVIDQLALVETAHSSDPTVISARLATNMFGDTQNAWRTRIDAKVYSRSMPDSYNCKALKDSADRFDRQYGTYINWTFSTTTMGRLFGITSFCKVADETKLPEVYMYRKVIQVLKEGSATADERKAQTNDTLKRIQSSGYSF